jgi:hypothetical protein
MTNCSRGAREVNADTRQFPPRQAFIDATAVPSPEFVLQSDIQPRMEACSECASFPHISLGQMSVW